MYQHTKKLIFTNIFLLIFSLSLYAQNDRTYIRECIQDWGECRNVAITKDNGNLALYGRNGWVGSGIPSELSKEMNRLNDEGEYISDIQLTEDGRWLIIYGDNGFCWDGIPDNDRLLSILKEANEQREIITAVSFNDYGDWIIVTDQHCWASDDDLTDWLREGISKFGQLWAVCIADTDGIVAVHKDGYRYLGDVPQALEDALSKTELEVYRVKFCGDDSWFFADKDGNFQGFM